MITRASKQVLAGPSRTRVTSFSCLRGGQISEYHLPAACTTNCRPSPSLLHSSSALTSSVYRRPALRALRSRSGSERRAHLAAARFDPNHPEFSAPGPSISRDDLLHELSTHLNTTPNTKPSNALKSRISELHDTITSSHVVSDPQIISKLAECLVIHSAITPHIHELFITAHNNGARLKLGSFEPVVFRLTQDGRWNDVVDFVDLAKRLSGRLSSRLLNWKIRALSEVKQFDELRGVIDVFREEGAQPTRRTFNILLQAHLTCGDTTSARIVLEEMGKAGLERDEGTYAAMTAGLRSCGMRPREIVEVMWPELRECGGVEMTNAQLGYLVDNGDIEAALGLFQQASSADVSHSVHLQSDSTSPLSLRDPLISPHLPSHNSTPSFIGNDRLHTSSHPPSVNTASFNILLAYFARHGNLMKVLQILDQLALAAQAPNDETAALLIKTCISAGSVRSAIAFLDHLFQQSSPPPATILELEDPNATTAPCPLPFSTQIQFSNIKPTTQIFNALLLGLLDRCGVEKGSLPVLDWMKASSVEPDATTLQYILSRLSKETNIGPEQLMTLLAHLPQQDAGQNLKPTIGHINTILSSIVRAERTSSHAIIPEDTPSDTGYDSSKTLLKNVVSSLPGQGLKPDSYTYALRIAHDSTTCQDPTIAFSTLNSMLSRGIKPSPYHFTPLMHSFVSKGDIPSARRILTLALSAGIITTIAMWTILIVGYGKIGKPDLAKEVFDEMVRRGVKADAESVHALGMTYWENGQKEAAKEVMIRNWPWSVESEEGKHGGKWERGRRQAKVREMKGLSTNALFYALKKLSTRARKGGKGAGGKAGGAGRSVGLDLIWKVIRSWPGYEKRRAAVMPLPHRLRKRSTTMQ